MEKMSAATYNKLVAEGKISVGKSRGKQNNSGRSKMGNVKTPDPEGWKPYDSKLEAKHAKQYMILFRAGKILSLARQPNFLLPGGVVYNADFLILHLDGTFEVIDSKGRKTQVFINKYKQFKEKFPDIKLTLIYQKNKTKKPS